MPITTRDGLLEAWATQIETMEQNLEDLYGPPGITPVLPDITTQEGLLEAAANGIEEAYVGIAKVYNAYHGETVAYDITLPGNLMDYYGIKKIGGRTIIMNQMQPNTLSRTNNGIVFTYDTTTGKLTIEEETPGATRGGAAYWLAGASATKWNWISTHKYLARFKGAFSSGLYAVATGGSSMTISDTDKFISNKSGEGYVNIAVTVNKDMSNPVVFVPVVYDLTRIFGAGNEPTTVEEFSAVFPKDFYEYNAGTLMNAGVTDIVVKDGNAVIETYTIPAEVQALAGYGLSCPNATNYIDFEAKKFVQYVASRAYEAGDESDSTVITDGTTTNYKLDAAVETDISEYITDNPIPHVESSWGIIFENQNGDDYRIPVPVKVEYIGV